MLYLGTLVILLLVLIYVVALWTQRSLNYWVPKISKKPKDRVPFLAALGVSLILSGAAVGFNCITEILRLIIK